tara:strand:- start:139 stop:579 length:441 start_codon:yes stop_codon:yes gene_type:complete
MNTQYFLIFIPMICVYVSGYYFPIKDYDNKKIKFKPPSYVFGIVWPILLTLIGISWYMRPQLSLYYGILTFLLSIWMVLYTYSKKLAFANIIATIFFTLYLISIKNKNKSKKNKSNILKSINNASLLLIPLVLWLSFASYLGYQSI